MTSKEAISATDPLILASIRSVMTETPPDYLPMFADYPKEKSIAMRCNDYKDWISDRSIFTALRKAVDAYDATVQHLAFMKEKGVDYMTIRSSYPDPRFLNIASDQDGFPEMDVGENFETEEEEEKALDIALYKYALGYEEMMEKDIKNYVAFLTEKANSVMVSSRKFIALPETVQDVDVFVFMERRARGVSQPPIPSEQRVWEARDAMGHVVPV